jgi:transcriptional regulator with XRE-family HTH domain
MGRAARLKPARLAKKLLRIRKILGLSQNELVQRMGLEKELLREEISDFERGKRVPSLPVLLAYGRIAKLYVDALIDDEVDLPQRLPSTSKSAGVKRKR